MMIDDLSHRVNELHHHVVQGGEDGSVVAQVHSHLVVIVVQMIWSLMARCHQNKTLSP